MYLHALWVVRISDGDSYGHAHWRGEAVGENHGCSLDSAETRLDNHATQPQALQALMEAECNQERRDLQNRKRRRKRNAGRRGLRNKEHRRRDLRTEKKKKKERR